MIIEQRKDGLMVDGKIVEKRPIEYLELSWFTPSTGKNSVLKIEESEKKTKETFVAVLSTTVLPLDGIYRVETIQGSPDIAGVPHYIGHPDTKTLVESFGAVQAESKLFPGLQPGEKAICFPIQQGKSTRATEGFTIPHQNISMSDLAIRIIIRIA